MDALHHKFAYEAKADEGSNILMYACWNKHETKLSHCIGHYAVTDSLCRLLIPVVLSS